MIREQKVFYRQYRPQKIEELDKEGVRRRLSFILLSKRRPHAFLFTGPRGTGKTSTARIVAKILNCEDPQRSVLQIEPCNKCASCLSITEGRNLDVIEIDAASNRGIDEIRDLREKIRLSPTSSPFKVYIVDEVHMLTNEAFNALLKTLEEPPAHVFFILCTTVIEKVPETIISRCTQIVFSKATTEEIVRSLERILKGEKLTAEKEVLEFIAKNVSGSFRDGAKVLEEAASHGSKITEKTIEEILGFSQNIDSQKFLSLLQEKKTKEAIVLVENLVKEGADLKHFNLLILEELRNILLARYGVIEKMDRFEGLTIKDLKKMLKIFTQVSREFKMAVIPQIPLEIAIIDLTEGGEGDV